MRFQNKEDKLEIVKDSGAKKKKKNYKEWQSEYPKSEGTMKQCLQILNYNDFQPRL